MHIGVTQLGINILGGGEAFIIQHQRPAEPPCIEPTAVEELQFGVGFSLNYPAAEARIAGQGAEHHIDDRPQHQVATKAIPVQRKSQPTPPVVVRLFHLVGTFRVCSPLLTTKRGS